MLQSLTIKNYTLIDYLQINFRKGFSVITGETGAGKSILLGGLGLVLGKRADLSTLRNKSEKCIIEAEFDLKNYALQDFFERNDLDYEELTIVRREILPSGKSRAFINDSPVVLSVLDLLGKQLIDVHSQHQTLELTQEDFQLKFVDAVAGNLENIKEYQLIFKEYHKLKKELNSLLESQQSFSKEEDYHSFLLQELESAKLEGESLEQLEAQYQSLSSVETIKENLAQASQILGEEQMGVLANLTTLKQCANVLQGYGEQYRSLFERINSLYIESDDLYGELQIEQENIVDDPILLEETNDRLQLIYTLQKKHQVVGIEELLQIKEDLEIKVHKTLNLESEIEEKRILIRQQETKLNTLAKLLNKQRTTAIIEIKQKLESALANLGMPNANFKIELQPLQDFIKTGLDNLVFLFSANKGTAFGTLKKVASGGELSRIMLTIKSILASYIHLPTIMFDEIDTGVSGEISQRMGEIMLQMSTSMQVFSITHLPQVASKGNYHYKVYKIQEGESTTTRMMELQDTERVKEIAEMLGGKEISASALGHAKELLTRGF